MAPRDRENNGNRQSVPTESVAEKVHYIGVRKKSWGRYGAEIRNHLTKNRTWLVTYDTAEEAAIVYHAAARYLRGPFPKANFPAPIVDAAFEASSQYPSSIHDNSAALDCRPTLGGVSINLPPLLEGLTPLAVSTDLHTRPLHSSNREKVKVDMGKQVLPWPPGYMNVRLGMQVVVDPSKGSTTGTSPLRLPAISLYHRHSFYRTSLLDCATIVQQPPMEMPLLGENVVSNISSDKSNNGMSLGTVNNLPPTTCNCCYNSCFGVLIAQVSHRDPGMKSTRPYFLDLNLPPPQEDVSYPAAMETTTPSLLDLNILPSED